MSEKKLKALVRKNLEGKRDKGTSEGAGGGARPGALCLGGRVSSQSLSDLCPGLHLPCSPALCCGTPRPLALWLLDGVVPAAGHRPLGHLDYSSPPAELLQNSAQGWPPLGKHFLLHRGDCTPLRCLPRAPCYPGLTDVLYCGNSAQKVQFPPLGSELSERSVGSLVPHPHIWVLASQGGSSFVKGFAYLLLD